jgi:hypothetical protein
MVNNNKKIIKRIGTQTTAQGSAKENRVERKF